MTSELQTEPSVAAAPAAAPTAAPRSAIGLLHIWVLSGFAVAQPLFDLLGRNAQFFVAHEATPGDIVTLTLGLIALVPLPPILLVLLARGVSRRLAAALLVLTVGVLATLIVAPPALRMLPAPAWAPVALAGATGVLAAAMYVRSPRSRSILTLLAPAPVVFAGIFVFASPVTALVFPDGDEIVRVGQGRDVPVIMLVLDEFPVSSLLTSDLDIDAKRFPNFARLAATSTWYRDTTTVHTDTYQAVPAILSGASAPRGRDTLPTAEEYPRSIVTALGSSHHVDVWERHTQICPDTVCGRVLSSMPVRLQRMAQDSAIIYGHLVAPAPVASGLPPLSDRWAGFGEVDDHEESDPAPDDEGDEELDLRRRGDERDRWAAFLDTLEPSETPGLHILHSVLPHQPWWFLPSGKMYDDRWKVPGIDDDEVWDDDLLLTEAALRKHLLQVQMVDRLLGETLDRLEAKGMYDDALVVVVADHGVSFLPGHDHRQPSRANLADIVRVPLFIKAPGQQTGAVDDRPVSTVDVLPTVLDMLEVEVSWDFEGVSLVAPDVSIPPDRTRSVLLGELEVFSPADVDIRPTVERIHERFPASDGGVDPFTAAPLVGVTGRPVASLPLQPPDGTVVRLDGDTTRWYDPGARNAPASVTGRLEGDPSALAQPHLLVAALNGTLVSAAWTYPYDGAPALFDLVLPETEMSPGPNTLELFRVIDPDAPRPSLVPLHVDAAAENPAQ